MIFAAIQHSRAADSVISQIEDLILHGVLRSGDRLPAERDLARNLDVSRPILREALDDLARRGLIVTRHGGGTFVADVTGEVFRQPVIDLIRSRPEARGDYLEYRRSLDETAAGLAATRATSADRLLLGQLMTALEAAHLDGDPAREAALDVEFHMAISDSTHNIVLLHSARACYRLLSDAVFYNRRLLYGDDRHRDALFAQHRAIYEAVIAGNAAAARAAATAHIDFVALEMKDVDAAERRAEIAGQRLSSANSRLETAPGRRGPAVGLDAAARTDQVEGSLE